MSRPSPLARIIHARLLRLHIHCAWIALERVVIPGIRILVAAILLGSTAVLITDGLAAADWPQFRGPTAQGHSDAKNLPLTWSEEKNVRWKVSLPGKGWSSPIGANDLLWMTTALGEGHSLRALCVHTEGGELLYDIEVFAPKEPVSVHGTNSYASPTPILEGDHLYVHFGSMGTACLDADTGKIVWRHTATQVNHATGPGTSPLLYQDLLIVPFDGADRQFVVALNKKNGKLAWQRKRSAPLNDDELLRRSFCTPLLVRGAERDQLISPGPDQIHGYDPSSGEEIWHIRYQGFSIVPRPVYGHELVFFSTGYSEKNLHAVRIDGKGDVTDTHVAWTSKRQVPTKPSPLLVDDSLYFVSDGGIVTCLDAKSGKPNWVQRLAGKYSASPVYGNGRIYLSSEDGKFTVLAPGAEARILATNSLDGHFMASPAVLGEAFYLRSETHLYRIDSQQ
jgi:outer membrane protein assembly factor BamB